LIFHLSDNMVPAVVDDELAETTHKSDDPVSKSILKFCAGVPNVI